MKENLKKKEKIKTNTKNYKNKSKFLRKLKRVSLKKQSQPYPQQSFSSRIAVDFSKLVCAAKNL